MSFQPVIPTQGIAGWRFLQRTYDQQFEAFNQGAQIKRDAEYFEEKIGEVRTAEDLVSDRRLLGVALGAFGLQDDINNRFFVQKILEDGTASDDALANRLADERYKRFSEALGFGPGQVPQTLTTGFADQILEQFRAQSFEIAVGEQDETMRIGLFAERELTILAESGKSDRAQWYSMMSLAPLRKMFETAMGLPEAFGQLDIDKQLEIFQDKAGREFGAETLADFLQPDIQEKLLNTYLARSQLNAFNSASSGASVASTLLQNAVV
ncbi:DUF1217 domain-containing protein [Thalassococcus sp. S3]|uniref:DUF1217 domain-containing protein n=1 Tax=Thalassococcus sp. S3 TaxID=2017482 RepID=UPI0010247CF0|nr:DUF1217 domain-containing protein [Thalassococcus sp. S3]QBF29710.1 flagellar protein [Thalassococcus sp. S3]